MWVSGRKLSVVGRSGAEVSMSVPVRATPAAAAVTLTGSPPSALPRPPQSLKGRTLGCREVAATGPAAGERQIAIGAMHAAETPESRHGPARQPAIERRPLGHEGPERQAETHPGRGQALAELALA